MPDPEKQEKVLIDPSFELDEETLQGIREEEIALGEREKAAVDDETPPSHEKEMKWAPPEDTPQEVLDELVKIDEDGREQFFNDLKTIEGIDFEPEKGKEGKPTEAEVWEQRFKDMQTYSDRRIAELQENHRKEIAGLKEALTKPKEPDERPPLTVEALEKEIIKDLGEDAEDWNRDTTLRKSIKRVAQAILERMPQHRGDNGGNEKIIQELEATREDLKGTKQQVNALLFDIEVSKAHPDWMGVVWKIPPGIDPNKPDGVLTEGWDGFRKSLDKPQLAEMDQGTVSSAVKYISLFKQREAEGRKKENAERLRKEREAAERAVGSDMGGAGGRPTEGGKEVPDTFEQGVKEEEEYQRKQADLDKDAPW